MMRDRLRHCSASLPESDSLDVGIETKVDLDSVLSYLLGSNFTTHCKVLLYYRVTCTLALPSVVFFNLVSVIVIVLETALKVPLPVATFLATLFFLGCFWRCFYFVLLPSAEHGIGTCVALEGIEG
jgi:hypothetical protein